MTDTEHPVLLITGASSGIGAATAKHAATTGYRVVLTARSEDKLLELVREIGEERALAVAGDVREWPDQQRFVQAALERFGRLDAAFANAGLSRGGSFLGGEDTSDAWREMILTNVLGVALTARAALPALVQARGHLLLTGSVAARNTAPGNLYTATKWAVGAMAESIRKEVTPHGVRVTNVLPGRVETPFWPTPMTRFPLLSPDDVARAVLYALSQPAHVDVNEVLVRPVGQEI